MCCATAARWRCCVTMIRDYLDHASVAATGRYITTNQQMKRDALETFWEHAGIEPAKSAVNFSFFRRSRGWGPLRRPARLRAT